MLPERNQDRGKTEKEILTPRQREVLGLVALGLSDPEIADQLSISQGTVKNHLSDKSGAHLAIYPRLGVSTRKEAVIKAIQLGILDPLELVSPEELARIEFLTERQKQVLECLTQLAPDKTMQSHLVQELDIRKGTVRIHLNIIYKKLKIKGPPGGVKSARAAVIFLAYQQYHNC